MAGVAKQPDYVPDTGAGESLDTLRDWLTPDPDSTYGDILPLARGPNGLRFAMPNSVRNLLTDVFNIGATPWTGRQPQPDDGLDTFLTLAGGAPKATNSLGVFGGRMAAKANLQALRMATDMEKAGYHAEDIWHSTGWFKDRDFNWKFEIPDSTPLFDPAGFEAGRLNMPNAHRAAGNASLDDAINHPELFENYPEMRNLLFGLRTPEQMGDYWGAYSPGWGIRASVLYADSDTLAHELQHGVQGIEGFPGGTSTAHVLNALEAGGIPPQSFPGISREDLANAAYNNAAGEIEARNVGGRTAMSPAQRLANPPWATAEQIKNPIYLHQGNVYVPVEHDPFAGLAEARAGLGRTESPANAKAMLQPVEHDPFGPMEGALSPAQRRRQQFVPSTYKPGEQENIPTTENKVRAEYTMNRIDALSPEARIIIKETGARPDDDVAEDLLDDIRYNKENPILADELARYWGVRPDR